MTGARVSCIVPCFDGVRFLGEALDSILAQSHPPFEVLVVDDGSTDDPGAVVRRYGDRVRLHRRENGGPGAACNSGLERTTGDFVAFLEQDDVWLPGKLERQLGELRRDPGLDYCVTQVQNFWSPGLAEEAQRWRAHAVMGPVPGYVVQTLLARRRAFERVGLFDASLRFACATDWFVRAEEAGCRGLLVPEVWTRRRLHEANYSRLHREASREQFLHVVKARLDRRRRPPATDPR